MNILINNWWLLPSLIMILVGILCPAIGTALIYKKKLFNANFISFTILPGLIISLALGLHPLIGGFIGGLIGALLSELPSFNKNKNTAKYFLNLDKTEIKELSAIGENIKKDYFVPVTKENVKKFLKIK